MLALTLAMPLGPVKLHLLSDSRPKSFMAAAFPDRFSSSRETQPTISTFLCGKTVHCGATHRINRKTCCNLKPRAHRHTNSHLLVPVLVENVIDVRIAVDLVVIVDNPFHAYVLFRPINLKLLSQPGSQKEAYIHVVCTCKRNKCMAHQEISWKSAQDISDQWAPC